MNSGDYTYIWQASDWPNWRFDLAALAGPWRTSVVPRVC
jgi:hypothetical protein